MLIQDVFFNKYIYMDKNHSPPIFTDLKVYTVNQLSLMLKPTQCQITENLSLNCCTSTAESKRTPWDQTSQGYPSNSNHYPLKPECVQPCGGVIESRCTHNLLALIRVASNPKHSDPRSVKPRNEDNNYNIQITESDFAKYLSQRRRCDLRKPLSNHSWQNIRTILSTGTKWEKRDPCYAWNFFVMLQFRLTINNDLSRCWPSREAT